MPRVPPSAICPTPATQNDGGCELDVSLCHACHVKRRWMSGCATPATQSAAASQAPKPVQARHPVPSVPRLPRKTTVDVSLCHACHVKRRWMSGCATPATQSAAASQAPKPVQARHPVPSAPRLPRKTTVDVSLCHACHAKCHAKYVKKLLYVTFGYVKLLYVKLLYVKFVYVGLCVC